MALNSVAMVGPQDEVKKTSGKSGGGKIGKVIGGTAGGIAGGMAGMATGGPAGAAVGATGGALAGASLGEMIGNGISPARQESTAIQRRIQSQGPQMVQSDRTAQLKQAVMALHQAPPAVQQEYGKPLVTAYMTQVAQNGGIA
jgi:outer membrane lipoprotein SlyB